MNRLRTGQRIRVDAAKGTVEVIDEWAKQICQY